MKPLRLTIVLALTLILGLSLGKRWQAAEVELASEPLAVAERAQSAAAVPVIDVPGYAEAVADRDWDALVQLLEAANYENRQQDHAAVYAGMRSVAADLDAAQASEDAAYLLTAYAELNPQDQQVRFQLAEILRHSGRYRDALRPVFEILDSPPLTQEDLEHAETLRDDLVAAEADRLQQEAELPALIAFYEELIRLDPINDAHRAALVEAQLLQGDADAAEQTLAGMGGFNVEVGVLSDLQAAIASERATVDLRQEGGGLFTKARVDGRTLNLLLDTGATQTALRPEVLADVQAVPLGRSVNVRTAGGRVRAQVYEVANFEFGGTHFDRLEVIALRGVPPTTDGLLGLDVLNEIGQFAIDR